MGKGDKKSKRGKIILGSWGVSRPRKNNKPNISKPVKKAVAEVVSEEPKEAAPKPKRKTAAKKKSSSKKEE